MKYAYDGFKEFMSDAVFHDPVIAFYSNVTGGRVSSAAELKQLAVDQIISPVRWIEEEQAIAADGYDRFIETGPGTVLAGLWNSTGSTYTVAPAWKLEQIAAIEP